VQVGICRPHIDADERGAVLSPGYVGRPVQERGAELAARVPPADDHPPDIQCRLVASAGRPDRPFVQVEWLFGVDGDRRGRGRAVPDDPGLAFDQVI
jgi:hypothetical protein